MTYSERLAEVNKRIGTTSIKGKEYAEVNQRVLAFWELFPTGRIITKLISDNGERCDFECAVYAKEEDERPVATGHAFEEKKGMINSTSYIENCETSAVGRALGMLGIGATNALASTEEVKNAVAQQQQVSQPAEDYMQNVRAWYKAFEPLFESREEALGNLLKNTGLKSMSNLTREQAEKAIMYMAEVYNERTEK